VQGADRVAGAKVPLFVTSPTIMPLTPSVPLVSTKTSLLLVPLMASLPSLIVVGPA